MVWLGRRGRSNCDALVFWSIRGIGGSCCGRCLLGFFCFPALEFRKRHSADKSLLLGYDRVDIGIFGAIEHVNHRLIHVAIGRVPFVVFVAILGSGDGENDEKGKNDETGGDCRELGEELEDSNSQEEDVGDTPKLL